MCAFSLLDNGLCLFALLPSLEACVAICLLIILKFLENSLTRSAFALCKDVVKSIGQAYKETRDKIRKQKKKKKVSDRRRCRRQNTQTMHRQHTF